MSKAECILLVTIIGFYAVLCGALFLRACVESIRARRRTPRLQTLSFFCTGSWILASDYCSSEATMSGLIRCLHLADIQLGRRRSQLQERTKDFFRACYDVIVQQDIPSRVDFLLIAG